MREKDWLRGGYPSGSKPVSELKPPPSNVSVFPTASPFRYQKLLDDIDRKDEMEDAVTLGRDCACEKNDPECKDCWVDEPIKFSIVAPLELSQFNKDVRNRFDECLELLLRKHKAYGPSNIGNAPGGPLNGLQVRIHDKVARINNLIATGHQPDSEPLRDSFLDLANYAVIALMVLDGAWPNK